MEYRSEKIGLEEANGRGEINIFLARKLTDLRKAHGISSSTMAAYLRILPKTYYKLEAGTRSFSIRDLEKISAIFQIPIHRLLVDEPFSDLVDNSKVTIDHERIYAGVQALKSQLERLLEKHKHE